jgi:2,4-dienoyl-CoA reductase-like NADH-dependent reductase (Old Yellow Enzyme family)
MTCASHVQAQGQGFTGQLGIYSDAHLPGLARLAAALKAHPTLAVVQLHHAGIRSPRDVIGAQPAGPSDDAETGARALSLGEVEQLAEDFIAAAVRAERAGFDGVEIHGAHGYVLGQFLSAETNRRDDRYGGSLENRSRLLFDVVAGVRARCRPDFNVGVRVSPERFGMRLAEARAVVQRLMSEGRVDYVDLSLWDCFKVPAEEEFKDRPLLGWFTDLERGATRLGCAGKITSGPQARRCLEAGADFAVIGRAAILHHDFPLRVQGDPEFKARPLPVPAQYLRDEGLGQAFVDYMRTWPRFVEE